MFGQRIPRRLAALAAVGATALILFGLAMFPEPPARLLTPPEGWVAYGAGEHKAAIADIPSQVRNLRRSVEGSPSAFVYRTWTPAGINPIDVTSPPFRVERYLSIPVTGSSRTIDGLVSAYIECEGSRARIDVFRGDVNVHLNEALIAVPADWCAGTARLRYLSGERYNYSGVGSVYGISAVSYAKSTFLGRLPYLLAALAVLGAVMVAGAALAHRFGWKEALAAAFVSLGTVSLAVFYLTTALSAQARWVAGLSVGILLALCLAVTRPEDRSEAYRKLAPFLRVWLAACLAYFSLLSIGVNGLGNWEPNYRFWPALWSSDNELPWIFAEALRNDWKLDSLFGDWKPTDRPPLMAGAHLLTADVLSLMQAANDGNYLRGQAYNGVSLALNALWVPASLYVLRHCAGLGERVSLVVIAFVAITPFAIFNTIYGWPKAFGAAFALLAFAAGAVMALARNAPPSPAPFLVLGAFSMLAHGSGALFLAPLGLLVAWKTRLRGWPRWLGGAALALALMGSWSLYKRVVLPSSDPVTRYALTGNFGFNSPRSVPAAVADHYRQLSAARFLEIKRVMAMQPFVPRMTPPVTYPMNADAGTGRVDRLRAWDMHLLSAGNAVLLAAPLLGLALYARRRVPRLEAERPLLWLVGVSLAAWALMLAVFFVPLIITHWPQAALFGLGIAGAALLWRMSLLSFTILFAALAVYTAVVWGVSAAMVARSVDTGACVFFLALVAVLGWRTLLLK